MCPSSTPIRRKQNPPFPAADAFFSAGKETIVSHGATAACVSERREGRQLRTAGLNHLNFFFQADSVFLEDRVLHLADQEFHIGGRRAAEIYDEVRMFRRNHRVSMLHSS